MDKKYLELLLQKVTLSALIFGALICLAMSLFDFNPLSFGPFMRTLLFLIGIAGIFHMFSRDFYLPFLGETVMPCSGLEDRTPSGADTTVTVHVTSNAKLIYWAAEPEADQLKQIQDWKLAYSAFKNIGVTTADQTGTATLSVRKPQAYTVPFKGRLEPHIHYRVCGEGGIMGRVNTVFINGQDRRVRGSVEGFANPEADGAAAAGNLDFISTVDPSKLISEITKDPRRLNGIINLLPGITDVMNQLNSVVAGDTSVAAAGEQAHGQPAGNNLADAFRDY